MRVGGDQIDQFAFDNCLRYAAQSPGNVMIFILDHAGKVLECCFQSFVGALHIDLWFVIEQICEVSGIFRQPIHLFYPRQCSSPIPQRPK